MDEVPVTQITQYAAEDADVALRLMTPLEQKLAEQTVGNPVQKEGVEDLLWAMIMLPEFQLIY